MTMKRQAVVFLLVGIAAFCGLAPAPQAVDLVGSLSEPVTATGYVSLSNIPQGGNAHVAIELQMQSPWHVNANPASEDFMVPTEVTFEPTTGITVSAPIYPAGEEETLSFSEKPLRLYAGTVVIGATIDIAKDVPIGPASLKATVTYQACDNEKCMLPQTIDVDIPLVISSPRDPVDFANSEVFDKIDFGPATATTTDDAGPGGSTNSLAQTIAHRGLFFGFVLVFLGGLALNLTPCVYPMIPITVSYFGGQSRGRGSRTILLAVLYLLGMATMYSALGLVAAVTGSLFGSALQNPIVTGVIVLVMIGLALSMFGFYEIRIPAGLAGIAGTAKQGAVGSFLMGLTVGIVAAPCIGPFVLGLLTFVGETGNPLLGFSLFFVLALGLGLPFVILAVASGNIVRLPKSGEWMEWIRKLFGVILLAMAAYFAHALVGDAVYFGLLGAILIIGGIALGFIVRVRSRVLAFNGFRRFVGVAAPLYGLYLILAPGHILGRGDHAGIAWIPYTETEIQRAVHDGKPVVIDFSAGWCLPCRELERETFSDPGVVTAAKGVVPLKADLTQHGSAAVRDLRKKYSIRGVPTIVFIDASGHERSDLRVVEFIDETEFLKRLHDLTG
jgi:thioredoxin:protein disulfide reductase